MNVSQLLPPSSEFHRTNICGLHCWCAQRTSNLSLVPSTFKAPCQPQGIHARVLLDGKDVENTSAVLQQKGFGGKPKQTWRPMEGISTVLLSMGLFSLGQWGHPYLSRAFYETLQHKKHKGWEKTQCASIGMSTNLLILNIRLSDQMLQYRAKNIFFMQFCLVCWEHVLTVLVT